MLDYVADHSGFRCVLSFVLPVCVQTPRILVAESIWMGLVGILDVIFVKKLWFSFVYLGKSVLVQNSSRLRD